MKEINVRFTIPEETHKKVRELQGLLTYKEKKKIGIQDIYTRLVERGLIELSKQIKV